MWSRPLAPSLVGVRPTPLIGYGLVIGLNRTGDKRQTLFTNLSLANTLERFGVVVTPEMMKVENIAAVMVSSELPPFARPGVRLDTHAYAGYKVPPNYDSLLAKLIVSGNSREEALVRARIALESFVIEGVSTTIPFLAQVTHDERFIRGEVDTHFLDRFMEERAPAKDLQGTR